MFIVMLPGLLSFVDEMRGRVIPTERNHYAYCVFVCVCVCVCVYIYIYISCLYYIFHEVTYGEGNNHIFPFINAVL
jgi:dolichyl-phosphate-mannose--protein O-mannosyl transferase